MTLKIILFIVFSVIIVFFSRKSLINIYSHGFYRFFAWEFIIILWLMNIEFWFVAPFSLNQLISWLFLFGSTYYVIDGYRLLRSKGKYNELRPEKHLYKIEKTTKLVTDGIYHYVRHPLYGSLLFLAWGIFFKSISTIGFILVLVISLFLFVTAKIEEKENCDYFGNEYELFMKRTKMFIPYVW